MVSKDCNAPCEDHKKVFLSVCGVYLLALITMIGYMVSNDSRARAAEVIIKEDLTDAQLVAARQHQDMMEKVMEGQQLVVQRLSKIEGMIK